MKKSGIGIFLILLFLFISNSVVLAQEAEAQDITIEELSIIPCVELDPLSNSSEDCFIKIGDGLLMPGFFSQCDFFAFGDSQEAQVARGECLFNMETFGGNGRTCASCHRPENNFTIDPKFISTLPPHDPLFVHEFNPALRKLENADLLRKFGLISANTDGFPADGHGGNNPPATSRGVPHTLGMSTSLNPPGLVSRAGKAHAIGWSGDGAPGSTNSLDDPFVGTCQVTGTQCQGMTKGDADAACEIEIFGQTCEGFSSDGSLKAFSIGATIQHFPQTMNRQLGVDFRLPTERELDDMAAYQLAQGRQRDFTGTELSGMNFNSPLVTHGRDLFFNTVTPSGGSSARCNTCHFNAGANAAFARTTNLNFATGVENLPSAPHVLEGALPDDPAFGRDAGFGSAANPDGGFGNNSFNSTSLIEAADTPPFFHNNSVNTIEQAVAFYNSDAFNNTAGSNGQIHLETTEVTAIAAFLRTINSLMNIDIATDLLQRALATEDIGKRVNLIFLAKADIEDSFQVLQATEYSLFDEAQKGLEFALVKAQQALNAANDFRISRSNNRINRAISELANAKSLISGP